MRLKSASVRNEIKKVDLCALIATILKILPLKSPARHSFLNGFTSWSNAVAKNTSINWTEQLSILNDVQDLITTDLSLEQITAAIYLNINRLIDAFQFAVGIYDEEQGIITYNGMIEDGNKIPDFSMDAIDSNRFASWCIRNEEEIFMNDIDNEYGKYLKQKPVPLAGSNPRAAIYVPLKLNNKVVGLITVRTIRKNVYKQHHLYILKTVGNFVVRTLELTKMSLKPYVQRAGTQKQWRWCSSESLSARSLKAFLLLTKREKEVLFLLVTGLQNKIIAEKLFVSPGTIKTHTLSIYQKNECG